MMDLEAQCLGGRAGSSLRGVKQSLICTPSTRWWWWWW